ncbi:MAG: hypothetical protein ACJAU9_001307 [Lentimonas sp.]|jgi:hypothetical protein
MLQREVSFEPRANKKLSAAASRHLLNDMPGFMVSLMRVVVSHLHASTPPYYTTGNTLASGR